MSYLTYENIKSFESFYVAVIGVNKLKAKETLDVVMVALTGGRY